MREGERERGGEGEREGEGGRERLRVIQTSDASVSVASTTLATALCITPVEDCINRLRPFIDQTPSSLQGC